MIILQIAHSQMHGNMRIFNNILINSRTLLMPFLVNLDRCVSTISFATNSSGCACGAYKTLFFFSEVAQPVSVLFTYPLAIAEEPNS
jgi:hypothetical protein